MHGIVSLLDEQHDQQVKSLWAELNREVGIRRNLDRVPFPHISYHVAAEYDLERLKVTMGEISRAGQPFAIRTAGLGIFTAPDIVLHLTVVRSPQLADFHRRVWEAMAGNGTDVVEVFAPESWMPHITLAQMDVTHEKLPDAVRLLSRYDLAWEIKIDNLALIYDSGEPHLLKWRMQLGA